MGVADVWDSGGLVRMLVADGVPLHVLHSPDFQQGVKLPVVDFNNASASTCKFSTHNFPLLHFPLSNFSTSVRFSIVELLHCQVFPQRNFSTKQYFLLLIFSTADLFHC